MLVILNDIAFNLKCADKYTAIKHMKQLIETIAELRKMDTRFKISACGRLGDRELADGYSLSRLFFEPEDLFPRNYKIALRTFLSNANFVEEGLGEIEYKKIVSKQCAYAFENGGFLLSIPIDDFEKEKVNCRYCLDNEKESVILNNLSHKNHIEVHRHGLQIRRYEFNPKHKINSGWGSEMDLSDEIAQKVLCEAIVAKDDPKHLIAKYNGNYYSFRCHLDVYYHGYRDDNMPQNLKNKLRN